MRSALRFLPPVLLCSFCFTFCSAQCTPTGSDPSVTICSPSSGATVTSPVTISAATKSSATVQFIQIYIDGVKKYETSGGSLNTQLSLPTGTHRLTVQAYNGAYVKQTENITVTGGSSCTATGSDPSVTICSPTPGATVDSPVSIVAATNSSKTVQYIQVYVDGLKKFETTGGKLNTQLAMTSGTHRLTVQASNGTIFKQTENITVNNGSGSGVAVAVSPTSATITTGATQQFNAAVTGSTNTAVGWYVDNVAGGNSTAGTISTTGLYTASNATGSHTIKAVSNADTSKSATATINVTSGSGTCTLNTTDPSITICQPSNGATVDSPVHIVAGTTSSKTVSYMQIYVDGVKAYQISANKLDTTLEMSSGTHRLTVQASNGTIFKQTINISVNGGGPPPPPSGDAKSLTYKYGNSRIGLNADETTLTPSNVNSASFGKLGSWTLDGTIFAQPLYWPNLAITGKGTFDVLFVATQHDSLYALDAKKPGSTALWKKSFLSSGVTTAPANQTGRTSLGSEVGITGTPVIDEANGIIYVSVLTLESGAEIHRLHALDVHTGKEMSFSPVKITATIPGIGVGSTNGQITFKPERQLQRAGLLLTNGVVYVPFGSYSDIEPYHGWIFAFDASNLRPISAWIASPDTEGAAVWQAGTAPAADSAGNVYVDTADGHYDTGDWGDSILKLKIVNGKLDVVDWFTPFNQHCLDVDDLDLGASGPMLVPSGQAPKDLLISGSKEGRIYVLDQANLGHMQSSSNSQIVQDILINPIACGGSGFNSGSSHRMYGSPAYWNGNAYLASVFGPLLQYKLGSDNKLTKAAQSSVTFTASGQSGRGPIPVVSSNGNSGGIVWLVNRNYSSGNSTLYAFDATDVSKMLYNSGQNSSRDAMGFGTVFTVPVVVNGRVFASASKTIKVYGLLK